jgi:fatty acid desaturase
MSDDKTNPEEPLLAYERDLASKDRRSKIVFLTFAIVFFVGLVIALLGTLQQLGSLSAHVNGVFDDEMSSQEATEQSAQP